MLRVSLAAVIERCCFTLCLLPVAPQHPPAPSIEVPRGWNATYTQRAKAVTAHAASAAFVLGEGETLHPEIGAAGLSAVFGARVAVPSPGRYRFGIEVEGGAAQLSATRGGREPFSGRESLGSANAADGAVVFTPWLDLLPGDVELVLSFQREGAGAARLRTLWEMELARDGGFPVEPLPSAAARVWKSFADRVALGDAALEGRALLERKGCTSCHAPGAASAQAVGVRAGPQLRRSGGRASAGMLARWILSPADLRPGSDMPDLFGESEEERNDARAIARFLAALSGPRAAPEPIESGLAESGRGLYHRVGCIACHGALAPPADVLGEEYLSGEIPAAPVSAPFGELGGKWDVESLAQMLLDPLAIYPDGRMPSMRLADAEAQRIAAYLVAHWGAGEELEPGAASEPDVELERGRAAFAKRGCSACHELGPGSASPAAPALDELDPRRGCLDPDDARTPRYDLREDERRALALGLRSAQAAAGDPAPIDAALRRMIVLDCRSCHALDGAGGPHASLRPYFTTSEEVDLGDQGRIPPDLSGVGSKLETAWLARVLAEAGTARPYMAARMPQFGAAAVAGLAEALAKMEGVEPHSDATPPASTDEMVLAGRTLMGRDAMACIACHVHGDHPPAGTPGTDSTSFAERLRYEWLRSFLIDPARFEPGTRMPAFGAGGRSTIRSVYGGDALRQIDALWAYFSLGEHMPAPPGLESSSGMCLEVGDEPRVFRTFLESAGSRGIAVGFPVGIHYAFDASAVRLVEVWKGDFLDASGAWADRGGSVSDGRGPVVWSALEGPPLVIGGRPGAWPTATGREAGYRFRGYRIAADGAPVFLYSISGVEVQERAVPILERGVLERSFSIGLPRGTWAWLRAGAEDRVFQRSVRGEEFLVRGAAAPDGSVWYGVEGLGPELDIRWEVAL